MTMFATLEEAIDAAREEFLADNPGIEEEDANIEQLNIQKYVMQDGDIMWQAEFFADDGEDGDKDRAKTSIRPDLHRTAVSVDVLQRSPRRWQA